MPYSHNLMAFKVDQHYSFISVSNLNSLSNKFLMSKTQNLLFGLSLHSKEKRIVESHRSKTNFGSGMEISV